MNKNIQMITLKHDPQPLKRKSITTPSPLTIHPNNPPATKKNTIKTMIPIIPSISITYYLFVSWHNIVTFREKFKKQNNIFYQVYVFITFTISFNTVIHSLYILFQSDTMTFTDFEYQLGILFEIEK